MAKKLRKQIIAYENTPRTFGKYKEDFSFAIYKFPNSYELYFRREDLISEFPLKSFKNIEEIRSFLSLLSKKALEDKNLFLTKNLYLTEEQVVKLKQYLSEYLKNIDKNTE